MKGTMNQPDQEKLRELNWRRPLTDVEQAELRAALAENPEALAELELESNLTQALERLPNAPVSSNFTARVLQAVGLETKRQARGPVPRSLAWLRHGWLPKTAAASLVVCGVLFAAHRQTIVARARLAHEVAAVSAASAAVSNPEDFDAIRLLNKPASADVDLLAALTK